MTNLSTTEPQEQPRTAQSLLHLFQIVVGIYFVGYCMLYCFIGARFSSLIVGLCFLSLPLLYKLDVWGFPNLS